MKNDLRREIYILIEACDENTLRILRSVLLGMLERKRRQRNK